MLTLISRFRRNHDKKDSPPEKERRSESPIHNLSAQQLNYCRTLLLPPEGQPHSATQSEIRNAWRALEEHMALVPEGEVAVVGNTMLEGPASMAVTDQVWVQTFFLDRYCVTNAEFAQFVADGGYAQEHLWPGEILSHVLQFVDSTGCAGPRFWANAQPLPGQKNHPVVGICWYEANAYAHWRGKRLPTPAEWQRAATWASGDVGGTAQSRYPWGDSFDPSRCNTWNSSIGTTVPSNDYYSGCTPNGVYQLIGNVWEWTSALFECDASPEGDRLLTDVPMGEIRGGAFDSYFASQATSQFRTGQALLYRSRNIGFRCCVSADQLVPSPDPYSLLEESGN